MKNNISLSKLTIIISTLPERKKYLIRILSFLKNYDCKVLVIGPIQEFKKKKNDRKINFIFYNKKKRAIHKWLALDKFIKTKYILNLADDDFVLPSYLYKAINFLETRPTFCAVESFALRFGEDKKKLNFDEYFLSHHQNLINRKYNRIDLFHGNLIRNVFRKKDYYKTLKIMVLKMNTHPQWDDYLFHFVAVTLNDKIHYFPEFGHLRSENLRTINIKRYNEKVKSKINILKDKKNIDYLCKIFSLKNKISRDKSYIKIYTLLKKIDAPIFKRSKADIILSIVTEKLFFFKINSFFILRNFFKFPINNASKIKEIIQILKYCKKYMK